MPEEILVQIPAFVQKSFRVQIPKKIVQKYGIRVGMMVKICIPKEKD